MHTEISSDVDKHVECLGLEGDAGAALLLLVVSRPTTSGTNVDLGHLVQQNEDAAQVGKIRCVIISECEAQQLACTHQRRGRRSTP